MRPSDRLLRRGIPKTDIRSELENWSDRLSRWERFWTAVVVGGLAIEVFVRLDRFFPHGIFDLIWPHSSSLGDIGDAMVFIGVFGELVVASRSGRVETALREENAKAMGETNERAAKAEQAAAEANLARAKLEASFRRRVLTRELTDQEERGFILGLSCFSEQAFALIIPPSMDAGMPSLDRRSEQLYFAASLEKLLIKSGWVLDEFSTYSFPASSSGVTVFSPFIYREGDDEPDPLDEPTSIVASALAGQLMRLDISTQVTMNRDLPTGVVVVAIGLL